MVTLYRCKLVYSYQKQIANLSRKYEHQLVLNQKEEKILPDLLF